jgi:glycine dehydrogenase
MIGSGPYSRQRAAYPALPESRSEVLASGARIDNVYGDRNLVCSCLPMEAFGE